MPISFGSTPATAEATKRASGARPRRASPAAEARRTAAAPSFSPEELPAVTVPPVFSPDFPPDLRNAGASAARSAAVVDGRGCSSTSTRRGAPLPLRPAISTATSSAANRPAACAAAQRCWLRSAKASWASRVTPYRSATSSAVSPSGSVP